jgi:hypothetical protein
MHDWHATRLVLEVYPSSHVHLSRLRLTVTQGAVEYLPVHKLARMHLEVVLIP